MSRPRRPSTRTYEPEEISYPGVRRLSPRTVVIAQMVWDGKSNREIAEVVGLTEPGLKNELRRIYRTLGIAGTEKFSNSGPRVLFARWWSEFGAFIPVNLPWRDGTESELRIQ